MLCGVCCTQIRVARTTPVLLAEACALGPRSGSRQLWSRRFRRKRVDFATRLRPPKEAAERCSKNGEAKVKRGLLTHATASKLYCENLTSFFNVSVSTCKSVLLFIGIENRSGHSFPLDNTHVLRCRVARVAPDEALSAAAVLQEGSSIAKSRRLQRLQRRGEPHEEACSSSAQPRASIAIKSSRGPSPSSLVTQEASRLWETNPFSGGAQQGYGKDAFAKGETSPSLLRLVASSESEGTHSSRGGAARAPRRASSSCAAETGALGRSGKELADAFFGESFTTAASGSAKLALCETPSPSQSGPASCSLSPPFSPRFSAGGVESFLRIRKAVFTGSLFSSRCRRRGPKWSSNAALVRSASPGTEEKQTFPLGPYATLHKTHFISQ